MGTLMRGTKIIQIRKLTSKSNIKQIICLAVTEPYAGSDVANIRAEAKKTPDGKYYIVNGEKKY